MLSLIMNPDSGGLAGSRDAARAPDEHGFLPVESAFFAAEPQAFPEGQPVFSDDEQEDTHAARTLRAPWVRARARAFQTRTAVARATGARLIGLTARHASAVVRPAGARAWLFLVGMAARAEDALKIALARWSRQRAFRLPAPVVIALVTFVCVTGFGTWLRVGIRGADAAQRPHVVIAKHGSSPTVLTPAPQHAAPTRSPARAHAAAHANHVRGKRSAHGRSTRAVWLAGNSDGGARTHRQ